MKQKSITLSFIAFSALGVASSQGVLVASWNFNSLSISTAGTPGTGGRPTSIAASSGTGTVGLTGFAGNIDDFGGTTINAVSPDPAEESLSLIAGGTSSPFPGNGGFITIQVNLTGFNDPIITYATQRTSTGFNSNQWSYSTDGTSFTSFGSPVVPASTYALVTLDFSSINVLDGASTAFFRYTVSGATGSTGNNRIDNIQINAVPEPGAALLGGLGLLALLRRRR